MTSRNL